LYPGILLKLCTVYRSFWVELFGSLRYQIMSSANRDTLSTSLPICSTFISSCLIALARSSRTMLNRIGESGHSCLVPYFKGNFNFSPLSMMLTICLSYIPFIMLRYIPSIPSYIRVFIMKWCWILSEAFFVFIEMIKWFLSLLLLMCCIMFIDLHMLNHLCIPGWSWLGQSEWSFWYVVGFGLPLFYRGFFHQCSLRRLTRSSPIWLCTCPVLG
jgi:hypothetical protein